MNIWANRHYYKTIYADCPWSYTDKMGDSAALGAATSAYPVMGLEDIKALPVQSIAHPDCTLLLWATMPLLPEAFEVIRAWGFTYKTCAFVWVKLNRNCNIVFMDGDIIIDGGIYSGLGHYVNGNSELVLLANQGRPTRLRRDIKQTVFAPVGAHSVKPEEVRERIDLLLEGPKVELFGRRQVEGWDVWGNEVS